MHAFNPYSKLSKVNLTTLNYTYAIKPNLDQIYLFIYLFTASVGLHWSTAVGRVLNLVGAFTLR